MRKKNVAKMFWDRNKLGYMNTSFSQEGEDVILQNIFCNKDNGTYIDVGAHHPTKYSNTYALYLKGWTGLNIDAMPGSMALFNKIRPKDINVEAGVSPQKGELDFYCFNEPALNTFDKTLVTEYENMGYKCIEVKKVATSPLKELIEKYLSNREIDVIDIDVEGMDKEIIDSIDWNAFSPRIVLAEKEIEDLLTGEINNVLNKTLINAGYQLMAMTTKTCIYEKKK